MHGTCDIIEVFQDSLLKLNVADGDVTCFVLIHTVISLGLFFPFHQNYTLLPGRTTRMVWPVQRRTCL